MKSFTVFTAFLLMSLPLTATAAKLSGDCLGTPPTNSMTSVNASLQSDPLAGKTILVFGDSYVKNHRRPVEETWHYLVAQRHDMHYINAGRNGSSIAFDRTRDGFGPNMLTRLQELPDSVDYFVVIAGHNDADKIKNSTDSLQMFRDSLDRFCSMLVEKYPAARLAWVTPWNVNRPGFDQVIEAIHEICGRHSIPVLDAAHDSGIHVRSLAFRKRYFQNADTAHLNAEGHRLILNWADRFIGGL
ncbi:MAG: SGNH/GDSL hydrolase family protein [Bacteroidales bacterium]|nr:SGNH/GDSL hydrolase family protein [Bacteroidales bacterium]